MLENFLILLDRQRVATITAAVILAAAGVYAAIGLSLNDSPERWMPRRIVDAWERFGTHFDYGDTIAVGIEFHHGVQDEDLAYLKQLRVDLLAVPGVNRVIDLSLMAEEIERVPLSTMLAVPREGQDDLYQTYRGILFDDPVLWRGAVETLESSAEQSSAAEPTGRTLLTFVELEYSPEAADSRGGQEELDQLRRRVVDGIYKVVAGHQRSDVTFHVVGAVVIQYELERIARRVFRTFVPLSLLLTLVALGWGFRSVHAVVIATFGAAWSTAVLLGAVAMAGWTLNVVTVGAPTLMAVIIVATTVHFAHYYSLHPDRGGGLHLPRDGFHSREHFLRWVAVPCFGAALATGLGFLMLAFNELGPARELGIELFWGSLLAFFGAFLMWILTPPHRAASGRFLSSEHLVVMRRAVAARPGLAVVLICVLSAGMLLAARRVRIDADPFSFFQPQAKIARALDHFSTRKFGYYTLDIVLVPRSQPTDVGERALARASERKVALAFEQRIAERPEVRNVISALSLRARTQSLASVLADFRRAMLFQETFKNWTVDKSNQDAIRITFMLHDPGFGFRPLLDEVRDALPQEQFDCFLTGSAASAVVLSEGLVGAIVRGLSLALAVMAGLCLALFRSVRLTLISFLPNAFPILVVFGLMGLADIPLNSGSAMVATIALGVALNDTIHFVMHYHRRRDEGETAERAVEGTFKEIGRPIILTSVVNCAGFGIFLLSDFRPMYHFGFLASVAMAAALVGDLIFLPNLLLVLDRSRSNQVDSFDPDGKL